MTEIPEALTPTREVVLVVPKSTRKKRQYEFTCMVCMETFVENKLDNRISCSCSSGGRHDYCLSCIVNAYRNSLLFFDEVYVPLKRATPELYLSETILSIINKTCLECKRPWEFKSWIKIFHGLSMDLRKKLISIQTRHQTRNSILNKITPSQHGLVKIKCPDIFHCNGYARHCADDMQSSFDCIRNHSKECQASIYKVFDTFLREGVTIDCLIQFQSGNYYSIENMEILMHKPQLVTMINMFIDTCSHDISLEEMYAVYADMYLKYRADLVMHPHCSRCKISQEKSDACNHMTCGKCTAETCFICGNFFPTMIPVSQYNELIKFWKVGAVKPRLQGDQITWYDHVCPLYSLNIFKDVYTFLVVENGIHIPFAFPTTEVEAAWAMRKIYFLIHLEVEKYPIYNISILQSLYPDFPCIPASHGIAYELMSMKVTWDQYKHRELEKLACNEKHEDVLYDISPYLTIVSP